MGDGCACLCALTPVLCGIFAAVLFMQSFHLLSLDQRRRTFFKYEKRIREMSPPEKVRLAHVLCQDNWAGLLKLQPTPWHLLPFSASRCACQRASRTSRCWQPASLMLPGDTCPMHPPAARYSSTLPHNGRTRCSA